MDNSLIYIMKKLLFIFAFVAISSNAFGQLDYKVADNGSIIGGAIVVEEIIENTELTVQQAHDVLVSHFANAFNDSNHTKKVDAPDHLIYKGKFSWGSYSWIWKHYVNFFIDVAIKENRVRIKCSADKVMYLNSAGKEEYELWVAARIAQKQSVSSSFEKEVAQVFNNTVRGMHDIITNAKGALSKGIADTDW